MSELKENISMSDSNCNGDDAISIPVEDLDVVKAKKNAELIVIGDDCTSSNNGSSLQDHFNKFRTQKIRERKLMEQCKKEAGAGASR